MPLRDDTQWADPLLQSTFFLGLLLRVSVLPLLLSRKGSYRRADRQLENAVPLPASGPTLKKFAAEYVERRSPSWKPSTVKATLSYLNSAILPALGHLRVGSVVTPILPASSTSTDVGSRAARIGVMTYCATCSTTPLLGAIGPKPQGDHPLPATAARAAARRR